MHVNVITASGVEQRSADELPVLLNEQDRLIWVDIPSCDAAAVSILTDVFGFHRWRSKTALSAIGCPRSTSTPTTSSSCSTRRSGERRGHVHYIELDQFVGQNYVVTVHGPLNPVVDPQVALRETGAVLRRIDAGRLTPSTPHDLSYAIVSALTRNQEDYIEVLTSDVWQLEQQVTGGDIDDPQEFIKDMFRARHGLLVVRTMGTLSAAIYGRIGTLPDSPPTASV